MFSMTLFPIRETLLSSAEINAGKQNAGLLNLECVGITPFYYTNNHLKHSCFFHFLCLDYILWNRRTHALRNMVCANIVYFDKTWT